MRLLTTTAIVATMALASAAIAADTLPLKELPGIEDRNYWVPDEVNADGKLEALQSVVGSEAVKFSGSQVETRWTTPSAA